VTRLDHGAGWPLLEPLFAQAPIPIAVLKGPDLVFERCNPAYTVVVGGRDVVGKTFLEALPEARGQGFDAQLRQVMRTGTPYVGRETLVRLQRGGLLVDTYFTYIYAPLREADGRIDRVIAIVNEVTEEVAARQRIEALAADARASAERLRQSEERYSKVLSLMPAAVYTCEAPSGRITYYNEHAAQLWGRAPAHGDTDERFCGSYRLWRADGSLLRHDETPMALAMRDGRPYRNQEVIVERPDGTRIIVLVNIDPLCDAQGRVTGAINVFHDVTERREAAEAVKASEERFRSVFESIDEGFCTIQMIFDAGGRPVDYRFLEANPAFERHTGLVNAVGRTVREFVPDHDEFWFETYGNVALSGQAARFESHAQALGRWFDVYCSRVGRPEDRKVAVVFQDISARKRVEQALRASEERYRAVVESQAEMVCRFRPDGTLLFVNGAYARALGSTPEALLAAGFWGHIAEADHAAIRAMLARMTPATPEATIENRLATVHGERWTLWTNRALAFDEAGRVTEAQSTGIDITERKRAEEVLREADRRKDEFLAILSHELRNPLAPIRNAVTLLQEADGDAALRRQMRGVLDRQVSHLIRLVDDLLDVARIGRGDIGLRIRTVRLAEVIAAAVETSRPRIESGRHALHVDLPHEALDIRGDPVRIAQVVSNLLNNAAAYTPQGGRIDLSVRTSDGRAAIAVRDNGVGLAVEALPSLFDMFSRGEVAKDHPAGFGIGLALSRRLVEMHGGTIEASSEGIGRGAEFTVRLPLAPRDSGDAPAPAEPANTAPKRILVVDDNGDAADSLCSVLKVLGNDVQVASDGPSALEEFRRHDPSVVILDIGMPGMNGYEVAREIRARFPERKPQLIALTGWGQDTDRQRAREAGFDHHVVKPAELGALEALLASIR
jgi:PAS domain S-box-containing protein